MTELAETDGSFHVNRDAYLSIGFALSMARHDIGSQDPRSPLIWQHYGNLTGLPSLLIQGWVVSIERVVWRSDDRHEHMMEVRTADQLARPGKSTMVILIIEKPPETKHLYNRTNRATHRGNSYSGRDVFFIVVKG
jgi:hypothetical protein